MLRDMFKKTYTKIDTRYRAPEAERTGNVDTDFIPSHFPDC